VILSASTTVVVRRITATQNVDASRSVAGSSVSGGEGSGRSRMAWCAVPVWIVRQAREEIRQQVGARGSMRLAEVLREQGRVKTWFGRQLGMTPQQLHYRLRRPSTWTEKMRERAGEVLGVAVEELFPLGEEGDITWLEYELRLKGMTWEDLAKRLGVSGALLSRMFYGHRSWRGREQKVGEILGIDPAKLGERIVEVRDEAEA